MTPPTQPPNQVNVLLVEDDELDVMLIRRSFEQEKIANPITVARDGLEALEMLRAGDISRPYLVLLDINMPRMNGHEFLAELRQDPTLHDAIVFVLTTSQSEHDRFQAYEQHVAGYLVKQNAGANFMEAVKLLEAYWRIVEFP